MQRAGVLVTEHTLLQVDVVFTALRIISNAILKMGSPRALEEEVWGPDNIPYRRYCARQPPLLTETWGGLMQYDGWRRTIMSMGLFGEAFWFVLERDKLLYPTALEVLHPAFMEVKEDPTGRAVYIYGTGMNKRVLDNDDVVHVPFMAMPQAKRALASVTYAGVAGALAMAAYEFGSTWFSQGASPSFLLTSEQKLGREEVERIASRFLIEHGGLQTAHMPLVLDSGLKAEKMLNTPDEAQYLNTLEYARTTLGAWFGVSDFLPSSLQRQTPDPPHTGQEKVQKLITFCLSGYTVPMEEAISSCLPSGQRAAFDPHPLSLLDAQFLAAEITALRQGQAATMNDIRVRKLGWAPLEHPAADEPIAPLASNTSPAQTENPIGSGDES